jgi:hypothetical protein
MPRPKHPNRLYVDLIHRAVGLYANYNPTSSQLRVGDYGEVTSTGSFSWEGNIYDQEFEDKYRLGLALEAAVECAPESPFDIASEYVTTTRLNNEAEAYVLIFSIESQGMGLIT